MTVESLKNFKQIVEILKINKIEKEEIIYRENQQSYNIHQLVVKVQQELLENEFVQKETLYKLGLLY